MTNEQLHIMLMGLHARLADAVVQINAGLPEHMFEHRSDPLGQSFKIAPILTDIKAIVNGIEETASVLVGKVSP